MRNALASSSTPALVLGAMAVSALIVWLSRPGDPVHTSQPAQAVCRPAELCGADRPDSAGGQGRPDYGVRLYPRAKQALDLLVGWLRGKDEAVKSPEPRGTEAGATSG
jgi:hypothetical protein